MVVEKARAFEECRRKTDVKQFKGFVQKNKKHFSFLIFYIVLRTRRSLVAVWICIEYAHSVAIIYET